MSQTIRRIVSIPAGDVTLEAALEIPAPGSGLVVFAHGSGSSRMSPRNRFVARELRHLGMATLLTDLLTESEDWEYHRRFDIALLARRLADVVRWAEREPRLAGLPLGLFGASTGAAAAIDVAAERGDAIDAVVCRGGRPDLASPGALEAVTAPTLLVVGGGDRDVLTLNEAAFERMRCARRLSIVPGATHAFEEAGTIETVAALAANWFGQHLALEPRAA